MPVYFDKAKRRWRFTFNRVISRDGIRKRTRATKLLPEGWGAARRDKYDLDETARLYALAAGLERPEPTIAQAVALYLEKRVPKLRNGKKVAQDLAHLLEPVDYLNRPISQFADVADKYVEDHPELADGTLHNRLAYLKSAGRHAWKKRRKVFGPSDPTAGMVIPRPDNARDVQLPVERVRALLAKLRAIDLESCALFTLAFRTGTRWRLGIWPIKPKDVERVGRDVWLHIGKTKNGQPRMKWIHPDARWALDYLPFTRSREYYWDRFVKARARTALEGFWGHDMRHVVATDIRKRGGSLEDVGAALDHISHASSARYAHITPAQTKRVLAAVGRKMHTQGSRRFSKKAA
jgi:integrase